MGKKKRVKHTLYRRPHTITLRAQAVLDHMQAYGSSNEFDVLDEAREHLLLHVELAADPTFSAPGGRTCPVCCGRGVATYADGPGTCVLCEGRGIVRVHFDDPVAGADIIASLELAEEAAKYLGDERKARALLTGVSDAGDDGF